MLIAAGVAGLALVQVEGGRIHVSATRVRPNEAGRVAAMRIGSPHTVTPPNDPFATMTYTDDPNEHRLRLEATGIPRLEFEPDYDVYEANAPGDWIVTPDGRARLIAIGVVLPPATADDYNQMRRVAYYRPSDHTPISVDQLPQSVRRDRVYADDPEPTFRFVFELEGFDSPDAIGYLFRDANTEARLTSGYGYSTGEDWAYVQINCPAWHGPTMALAMNLTHGPVVEQRLPAEPGATWRHGPLHVEVLRKLNLRPGGSYSHGLNEGKLHASITYRDEEENSKPFHGLLVGMLPHNNTGGLDMDLLDANGKVIRDRAHVHMSELRYLGHEAADDEIAALRLRWRPQFKRLVWRVPLPVIDEANRSVTDLTRVRVAYVKFENEWNMREFLAEGLQVEIDYTVRQAFDPGPGYFPATFQDTTLGEILDAYRQHVTGEVGHHMAFDKRQMKFVLEPDWPTRMKKAIEQFIDRLF